MELQLVDICLPDYVLSPANIAVPVSPEHTYDDLVERIMDEWHNGAGPDGDSGDVLDAVADCLRDLKDGRRWSELVWDFQPFDNDSEVCAYFNLTEG